MRVDSVRYVSLFLNTETTRSSEWHPATDVYRTRDGWLVKFELPGVHPEDLELSYQGRFLRIRGRRRDCSLEPDCCLLHMEIAYSQFERQIELPADLQTTRITTEFHLGMLLVRIQRERCP